MRSKKKKSRKKNTKKSRPTENTPRNPHQAATATISRQRATKRVPRVSPYSPASIDPEFVEIGLVQLSQSVETTNVTHTRTHRLLQLNNGTLCAPWYEKAFLPIGKKTASLLVESKMSQGGLILAAGHVRSKKKKKNEKNPPHPKHITKCTAARRPRPL